MGNHRFNDLEGWEIEGADKFDVVSECGNSYLIGGHCIFGENAIAKKRMRIPKHSKIRI